MEVVGPGLLLVGTVLSAVSNAVLHAVVPSVTHFLHIGLCGIVHTALHTSLQAVTASFMYCRAGLGARKR